MVFFKKKTVLLKFHFQSEDHLDAYFLIYTLNIYRVCIPFQLFSRGIRMHIPILTVVQTGNIAIEKWSYFARESTFEAEISRKSSLVDQLRVLYSDVLPQMSSPSFLVLRIYDTHPDFHSGFEKDILMAIKMVIFCQRCTSEAYFLR